ncbi:MAG: L-threonylcarbamoyladenylate synthase [Bacteroidetes bacterium]|nr:L-threonylcarbamoyladenylate synthase [Bacteroidota bacterium]MDA0943906.1 L-threonylcarbamoyladenylate synthase [Bacteroidota bacterium]MDA1112087.1 L-threonylcarbamoyladenylate synthase [Bacteroidota bacterium]
MRAKRLTESVEAAELLSAGQLVAIPTETVYGLAANGLDDHAVARIFEAKKRPFFDPLILHIGSTEQAKSLCQDWPDEAEKLSRAFWPGPLTLILPKSDRVPNIVSSDLPTVGIRMPKHALTLELLNQLEFPLAAPSANPFGYVSPTTAEHVLDQLGESIEAVLDGGPCQVGIESTIVKWDETGLQLLRLGAITQEQIEAVVGTITQSVSVSQQVQAPGQLEQHYSPHCGITLFEPGASAPNPNDQQAVVYFQKLPEGMPQHSYYLSQYGELSEAAASVFSVLRNLDKWGYAHAFIELAPKHGLGLAINDRLKRAAAKR